MSKNTFKLETTSDRASTLKKIIDKERSSGFGSKGGEFNAKKLSWYVSDIQGEPILGQVVGFNGFFRTTYSMAMKDLERGTVCLVYSSLYPQGSVKLVKGPLTVNYNSISRTVYECSLLLDDLDIVDISTTETTIDYLDSNLSPCQESTAVYSVLSKLIDTTEHKALCLIRKKTVEEGGGGGGQGGTPIQITYDDNTGNFVSSIAFSVDSSGRLVITTNSSTFHQTTKTVLEPST